MPTELHELPFHTNMVTGVQYGTAPDGTPLLLDYATPRETPGMPAPEKLPVVMDVHGGGWHLGEREIGRGLVMSLLGFFYISIDYRLSDVAPFPAQIHDVKAAIRWVRANADELHLDPDRIGLRGGSAGGHLITLAACTADMPELEGDCGSPGYSTRVHAIAAVNPPTDLTVGPDEWPWLHDEPGPTNWMLGGSLAEKADLAKLASPMTHIHKDAPPHLLLHGTEDDVVDFRQASKYHNALLDLGVESTLIAYEGDDHGLYGYSADIWARSIPFFQQHLGQAANYGDPSKVKVITGKVE